MQRGKRTRIERLGCYLDIKKVRGLIPHPYKRKKRREQYEMSYNGNRKFISTTIPYDEGWTVYDNGNKVKLQKNWSNFISFELDDTEDHQIKLIYRPNGFYTGAAVSLSALLLVVLYMVFRKVRISRGSF